MQMHPPNQLRQIHEERIARYIKQVVKPQAQKPEKEPECEEKKTGWSFSLLKQPKKATRC